MEANVKIKFKINSDSDLFLSPVPKKKNIDYYKNKLKSYNSLFLHYWNKLDFSSIETYKKITKKLIALSKKKQYNHNIKEIQGQRLDFSSFKFLNSLSSKDRLPLLKLLYTLIVKDKNQQKVVFCDNNILNELKDDFLIQPTLDVIIFEKIDEFEKHINSSNSISKVYLLNCQAADYINMQFNLKVRGIDCTTLKDIALENPEVVPDECFIPIDKNIYPIFTPEIKFEKNIDMLLLDCPSRNLSMMPNGLGYVHEALKKININHQTFDLDIITYHKYHMHRIYDHGGEVTLPSGRILPRDPWQAEHYDIWNDKEVIQFFMPIIYDVAKEIIKTKPKILGLSIQSCSHAFNEELAKIVKKQMPSIIIVVGGFSCYNPTIGLSAFPLADYMCIGEADLTIGPLIKRLINDKKVKDMPGIISKNDSPARLFVPAPMENDLDSLNNPRYEWFPLSIYRNWDGYQLTPVIASRGCRWSRCTFCAERFYWRIRDPKKFVDELEYLVSQDCYLFMFNESDLNGNPDTVLEICDEIINRGLKIKLTAQLRIHKKSDKSFFMKLKKAGFVVLRFGVDAFSKNTLRLQKKGYSTTTPSISNLTILFKALTLITLPLPALVLIISPSLGSLPK